MTVITGDETFTRFRRKLEDVVTAGLAKGRNVSADTLGAFCPIGCIEPFRARRPGPVDAAQAFGITEDSARAFIRGFECCPPNPNENVYYKLGQLYRRRFP